MSTIPSGLAEASADRERVERDLGEAETSGGNGRAGMADGAGPPRITRDFRAREP